MVKRKGFAEKYREKTAIFLQKSEHFRKTVKKQYAKNPFLLRFWGFFAPNSQAIRLFWRLTYIKSGFRMHSIKGADGTT